MFTSRLTVSVQKWVSVTAVVWTERMIVQSSWRLRLGVKVDCASLGKGGTGNTVLGKLSSPPKWMTIFEIADSL